MGKGSVSIDVIAYSMQNNFRSFGKLCKTKIY